MFVNSTLLGSLDRLNVKSILTSATGSILGLIGSIAFIVLCFYLFLGPVRLFFQGDFVQSSFITQQPLQYVTSTGCDFKMAIAFYHKGTGEVANITQITEMLNIKIYSVQDYWDSYSTNYEPCSKDYFEGLEGDPKLEQGQCLVVPENLRYKFSYTYGYSNLFGFRMDPKCPNPFLCSYQSEYKEELNERLQTFFDFYYFVFYFTTKAFTDYGHIKFVVNEGFSSNFDLHEEYMADIFPIIHTKKSYMDDTIMPWYNNKTYEFMAWDGFMLPNVFQEEDLAYYGVGAFLIHYPKTQILFRYYHKLDWLIGILGGGIFLLFLLFWIPCNYINTVKQKIQNCEALTLSEKQKDPEKISLLNLEKTKISFNYYITNLFGCCDRKTQAKISYAQRQLDIARVIKKQKVASRNLKNHQRNPQFKPRELLLENKKNEESEDKNPESEVLEIHPKTINYLRSNSNYNVNALENNQLGLATIGSQIAQKKIKENMSSQKYHKQQNSLKKQMTCCEKFGQFLKFFDVFGAKPTLVGSPHHASIFSMILTFIIIILAILTFALTFHNMNITRTYMDRSFVQPEDLHIDLTVYKNFRMTFCPSSYAFSYYPIVGPQRIANLQFFQAKRKGSDLKIQYIDSIWMKQENRNYFQHSQEEQLNLQTCFRMPDNQKLQVYGSENTEEEAYFGVNIEPYCSGSLDYCQQKEQETQEQFFDFINQVAFALILPQNKYSPQKGKIISDGVIKAANKQGGIDNVDSSFEETVKMKIIQLDDDTHNWWIGDQPQPIQKTLTGDVTILNHETKNKITSTPYYRYNVKANGEVQRIILSNYKVDFLFATIGGCFLFFFMIFGCFGRLFNSNRVRKIIAQELYTENLKNQSCCSSICSQCPCSESCQNMKKIQDKITNDLDTIGIVRNVDASYRLSSAFYPSLVHKNMSLIYLKEIIDSDETILEEGDDDEVDFVDSDYLDFESDVSSQKQELAVKKVKTIESAGNLQSLTNLDANQEMKSEFIPKDEELEVEDVTVNEQVYKKRSTFEKVLGKIDIFSNNNQLTFEGKRSVQSICGGVTCILFLILTILLTQYFLTVYFDESEYSVSYETIYDNKNEASDLQLTVGETFKFLVSFLTPTNYEFHDVSSLISGVGLSMMQVQHKRENGKIIRTVKQVIDLVPCETDYLQGFYGPYTDKNFYKDINLAYCVPDNTKLKSYGLPYDEKSEDFMLSIYNKDGTDEGAERVDEFLSTYLLRYHMSVPMKDFKNHATVNYEMDTFIRNHFPLNSFSVTYNMTFTKVKVQYNTDVDPSVEQKINNMFDYDYEIDQQSAFAFGDKEHNSYNITFNGNQYMRKYTVKKIKANELFGLVGGVILFLFFGIGAFVKSYNDYRMRYLIGSKLYQIRPSKIPVLKYERKFGKKISKEEEKKQTKMKMYARIKNQNNMGEPQIILAWFLSLVGFIRGNYNFNNTLRLVSLIEKRASQDMNIINFYKNMFALEKTLQNSKLFGGELQHINFSRVYFKHIVRDQYEKIQTDDEFLVYAAQENDLSDYEIHKIEEAKKSKFHIEDIFEEKWLDKSFNTKRQGMKEQKMSKNNSFDEKVEQYPSIGSYGELASKTSSRMRI